MSFFGFGGKSGSGKYIHSCNRLIKSDELQGYSTRIVFYYLKVEIDS